MWPGAGPALMIALALAGPGLAAPLGQTSTAPLAAWRVVGATLLCLILGVAGVVAMKVRRDGGRLSAIRFDWRALLVNPPAASPAQARLKVLETVRLGHQVEVSLLVCDNRQVLIATSPQGAFVVTPGDLAHPADRS